MRSGEITFKLSNDVFNDAVELVARKTSLMGAVNHPIAGDIEARMLDDVAKQLGKTLLTKSQKIRFIGRWLASPNDKEIQMKILEDSRNVHHSIGHLLACFNKGILVKPEPETNKEEQK